MKLKRLFDGFFEEVNNIEYIENKGYVVINRVVDPKIKLSLSQLSFEAKPGNWFTKTFWRFIKVIVEPRDMSIMTNLKVKEDWPVMGYHK